jgi:hypothetical protein
MTSLPRSPSRGSLKRQAARCTTKDPAKQLLHTTRFASTSSSDLPAESSLIEPTCFV